VKGSWIAEFFTQTENGERSLLREWHHP